MIENTNRLSNHSFGMTIDINASQSQYWQWDLKKKIVLLVKKPSFLIAILYHGKLFRYLRNMGLSGGGK